MRKCCKRTTSQPDAYPFVLPYRAVAKLQFIHKLVTAGGRATDRDQKKAPV